MKRKTILLLTILICPILARPSIEQVTVENLKKEDVTDSLSTTTLSVTTPASPSAGRRHETLTKEQSDKGGFIVTSNTQVTSSKLVNIEKNDTKPANPIANDKIIGKSNEHVIAYENYPGHAGVAEPISMEDYEKAMHVATERVEIKLKESSTPKDGISTWILLSGSDPTNRPDVAQMEEKPIKPKNTPKPSPPTTKKRPASTTTKATTTKRPRTTTTTQASTAADDKRNKLMTRVKASILNENLRRKAEEQTEKAEVITKKPKKTTTSAPVTTTKTTTTELTTTSTTTEEAPTTAIEYVDSGESAFLILEPKDAEFNLPQDRSPGKSTKATTKKPKTTNSNSNNNKKKKNANKKKKPEEKLQDGSLAKPKPAKEKPMSTQIMNYLSREVMPTVGVGLVGLVVTAGLASYFFGTPLTGLRRSDATNRKDDLYYSNIDDYAGADGQNEEEMFGKLIAGMPDKSFYRNSLRYRAQPQAPSQPMLRTGHQYGNYHVQSYNGHKYPQIKYRNIGFNSADSYVNYNQQAQAKSQNDYHYHTHEATPPPQYVAPTETTTQTTTKSEVYAESTSTTLADYASNHESLPNPEAYKSEQFDSTLRHRTQFVVGSVIPENIEEQLTSAPVPEHGPRKKRETETQNVEDNEIDNEIDDSDWDDKTTTLKELPKEAEETTIANLESENTTLSTENSTDITDMTTSATQNDTNLFEFVRRIIELKVRLGLNFLQNATSAFTNYLNGVQTRVDQAPLFNQPIN